MLNYVKDSELLDLEEKYDKIKCILGDKLAEYRQFAGFPKRSYPNGSKSDNILFNSESGKNLPNADTIDYYVEFYGLNEKQEHILKDLQRQGKQIKTAIIRKKRGWD